MSGSWSIGGNLNSPRYSLAGAGIQTAGLSFGGDGPNAVTEEYNGTSWCTGGDLNVGRSNLAGCGSQIAALSFGGYDDVPSTEEYNGVVWCIGGNLSAPRGELAGCGTQNAGLSFGGYGVNKDEVTEEYDGSSWSSGGDLNVPRYSLAGCGTQTAGLSFGGSQQSALSATEEYNGTSWSTGGDLNDDRYSLTGCGTQTAGLSFGGIAENRRTEEYDGSSWSLSGDLNNAKYLLGGCGTQSRGLAFGGESSSAVTEEYNQLISHISSIGGRCYVNNLKIFANACILYKIVYKSIKSNAKIRTFKIQYICCRTKITRLTDQMKTWDMLVKENTPPFRRLYDIAWSARIKSKAYEVIIKSNARTMLRKDHPDWKSNEHTIQGTGKIILSFERGKVFTIFKDRKKMRLRFIFANAHVDNPRQLIGNAKIGINNNQIQGNSCIIR